MKIKKDDRFRCIKDLQMIMTPTVKGEIAYHKGNLYISECDNCITDDQQNDRHQWSDSNCFREHFIKIKDVYCYGSESNPEGVIAALEEAGGSIEIPQIGNREDCVYYIAKEGIVKYDSSTGPLANLLKKYGKEIKPVTKRLEIKTYQDLIDINKIINGVYIDANSKILKDSIVFRLSNRNMFLSKKEAKSALAMAQISQLMPYYGGAITDEELDNYEKEKFSIIRVQNHIETIMRTTYFHYLSFHTPEQRDSFLENNKQLVLDYLMVED